MSISTLMSIGTSAMKASYAQMQTTSNNIANANTVGYSEQNVQLAAANGEQTNVGFFGTGVDVATVTRAYSQFLTGEANQTQSTSSSDAAYLDQLNQLQALFTTGKSGIGYAAGNLLNDFANVANNPSDSSARQVVLSDAQQLATQLQNAGQQVSALQSGLVQTVQTSLATVNGLAKQVASLNAQIAEAKSSGQPPNTLLDQRDQLIKQIGSYVNVTTIPAGDGSLGVFIGGGQSLVLGASANTLSAVADPYDDSKVQVAVSTANASAVVIPSSSIPGGSIGGLLKAQNVDIPAAQDMLGQVATAISGAMNQQQSLGLDLSGQVGQPIFSTGAPESFPNSSNTGTAVVGVNINNSAQVLASDYQLSFDGTNYTMTRLSDGTAAAGSPYTAAQLSAGVSVDGVTVALQSGVAQAGDSFLLRPVAAAASSMQVVMNNPSALAAASPFTASLAATNTGTANVQSITAASTGYNPALSATISFTSGSGNYNWTLSDGTSGTGTWTAGTPISLNGFALQLSGVPANGDTINVAPTTTVSSNNSNAEAFFNLGTQSIMAGQSITNGYAGVLANVGVRVQSATAASTASTAAATAAQTAQANASGVNLDQEASRLIQFQQSYQAAAKVLQVAQSVFTTLLQSMSGN